MHLLLVDDHPLFCVGFAHALQAARPGLLVEIAPTLQQGLDRAAEHRQFDIALIDYRLGERNGIEGLRQFAVQHLLASFGFQVACRDFHALVQLRVGLLVVVIFEYPYH